MQLTNVVTNIIKEEPAIDAGLPNFASIISVDDLINWDKDSLWLEAIGGDLMQLTKRNIAMLIFIGAVCGFDKYGSIWRYWNFEPIDEQRKAAKWDD